MLMLDKTSERLRSKHVRTLELLQRTLDENGELRDRINQLQKGSLLVTKTEPHSNRTNELEDEIDRLKAEHCAKVLSTEEAARIRRDELQRTIDALQTKQQQLQNDIVSLETKLSKAREALQTERIEWHRERQDLMHENQTLRLEIEHLTASHDIKDNEQRHADELVMLQRELDAQHEQALESDLCNRRLHNKIEALTTELSQQGQCMSTQHSELEDAKRQIGVLHEREGALRVNIEVLEARIRDLEEARQQLQRTVDDACKTQTMAEQSQNLLKQHQQEQAAILRQLQDMEEQNRRLVGENRTLQDSLTKLQTYHAELTRANSVNGSIFATHIDLKRENFHLRAQIDELKALQRRYLTTANKKTMKFPAI